jgi:hypothetical protein
VAPPPVTRLLTASGCRAARKSAALEPTSGATRGEAIGRRPADAQQDCRLRNRNQQGKPAKGSVMVMLPPRLPNSAVLALGRRISG